MKISSQLANNFDYCSAEFSTFTLSFAFLAVVRKNRFFVTRINPAHRCFFHSEKNYAAQQLF
jgi:hypothetical protein